eukprot:TRINITY_DN6723_c0_g2_i1.p1 TRINITY_DN6723_c0_g2~~TRINITY_DN6723_c0_g2_i1.p1  ORF type:complete len:105 (+),score=19.15 TRINITY_DN6723_c0_g2_i1:44-358(+)
MNFLFLFLLVFIVPVGTYYFWLHDGFRRVLKWLDLIPAERRNREAAESRAKAEAESHSAPGVPNFGADEFDQLINAYHWEEAERRRLEEDFANPRSRAPSTVPE